MVLAQQQNSAFQPLALKKLWKILLVNISLSFMTL